MFQNSIFAILIGFCLSGFAQKDSISKGYLNNMVTGISLSTSGSQWLLAADINKTYPILFKKRFSLGFGIRFNAQGGRDIEYTTAPAILTSKQRGPQVLFSQTYPENIDTLNISNPRNYSFNITINMLYKLSSKFDVGFNIDAVGFSFGPKVHAIYHSKQSSFDQSLQSASPTKGNLLLVSDNDYGMLNSEIFVRYKFHKRLLAKAGFSFLFTEYTTNQKLRLDNDRFRSKSLQLMLGLNYNLFR